MKNITILGKDIAIAFNMKVQLTYEEITGRAFELKDLAATKYRISLYYSAIISSNPDTDIQMDDILSSCSLDEITELDNAISEEMKVWYKIPETAETPEPAAEEGKSGN